MNVARAHERVKQDTRGGGTFREPTAAPCEGNPYCINNEELNEIALPTVTIDPAEPIAAPITLTNHGPHTGPRRRDQTYCKDSRNTCTKGGFETDGYCVQIHIDPEWSAGLVTAPICHHFNAIGSNTTTFGGVELPAPFEEGTFNVDVWLESPDGQTTDKLTRSITYQSGGSKGCQADGDCPRGYICRDGACVQDPKNDDGGPGDGPILPCFLDPNRKCASPEMMAWGGFALMFLVVVLGLKL